MPWQVSPKLMMLAPGCTKAAAAAAPAGQKEAEPSSGRRKSGKQGSHKPSLACRNLGAQYLLHLLAKERPSLSR